MDELRHPDPAGAHLLGFLQAIDEHISGGGKRRGHSYVCRSQPRARLMADAQVDLDAVVAQVRAPELVAQVIVRAGEPATEIALVAHEHNAVAIVMATHGRTGVARTLLGSVAGKVVHCSYSPVVPIQSGELRPAEEPIQIDAIAIAGQPA